VDKHHPFSPFPPSFSVDIFFVLSKLFSLIICTVFSYIRSAIALLSYHQLAVSSKVNTLDILRHLVLAPNSLSGIPVVVFMPLRSAYELHKNPA
jgi:hypothetical protein